MTPSFDSGPRGESAVVFLHGWLMGPELWRAQIESLTHVRCYAVAQPGHGGSPLGPQPPTMTDWARHLMAELQGAGIGSAVLAGHSMGGMLALEFQRQFPGAVRGLCLAGTTDRGWDEARRAAFIAGADATAAGWSLDYARLAAGRLVGRQYLESQPAWVEEWHATVTRYDLPAAARLARAVAGRDDLTLFTPTIRVPTVVIHGRSDTAVDFAEGVALAERIPAARLVAIDNCGHAAPMERPHAVTEALRSLVKDAGLASGRVPHP